MRKHHLEMVLKWRTHPDVTQFMASDIENNFQKQKQWFEMVSQEGSASNWWIINYQEEPVGVIALDYINWDHKYATWDYYIGEKKYRSKLGGFVPIYLYNYSFGNLKLNKLVATVMEGNEKLIDLHKLHGYRQVGVYQKHIFKQNQFHDLYILELLSDKWYKDRKKYQNYTGNFER